MGTGLNWEECEGEGGGGGMCKNSLVILNYNEIIAGGLGMGVGF